MLFKIQNLYSLNYDVQKRIAGKLVCFEGMILSSLGIK